MVTKDNHKNMMSYLRQADATYQNGFESEKLQQIFLRNTFDGISGCETRFCLQKSFSFILEGMIKKAELMVVVKFFEAICGDWKEIASSPGGCHVLQSVYEQIMTCISRSKPKSDDIAMKKLAKLSSKFDFLSAVSELSDVMKDTHSTFAFRYHLQMLGGILLCKSASAKHICLEKENVPKGFQKKLRSICQCLCQMHDREFLEFLSDPHASPSITCILQVIGKRRMPKTLRLVCNKVIFSSKDNLFVLLKDKYASHVFESLLQNGGTDVKKEMRRILCNEEKVFFDLCVHPTANFVIQQLILCFDDERDFVEMFDFIIKGLEDVLSGQNYGIVQKLCEQCVKFEACQKAFYDKLLEAFHCESADDRFSLVLLLASLRTHDSYFENGPDRVLQSIEYHGAVLLQSLLKFKNIGLLVKSMCSISIENVVALTCHSCGSHFVDEFFTLDKIKFKIKRDLVKKLKNEWVKIACDKYGSRVLENIWDSADITIKRLLAEALVKNASELSEDGFGKFIYKKCQLKRYLNRSDEWESIQKQLTKKRKMFEGIIPESKSKRGRKNSLAQV